MVEDTWQYGVRTLWVMEHLIKYGPSPLSKLEKAAGFSRASVWRALTILRNAGWVRKRCGDHCFEITHDFWEKTRKTKPAFPHAELVSDFVIAAEKGHGCHVDVGLTGQNGIFTLIESSRRDRSDFEVLSVFDHNLALVPLYNMPYTMAQTFLNFAFDSASAEEKDILRANSIQSALRRSHGQRAIWERDGSAVSIYCNIVEFEYAAFRLELKILSKKSVGYLKCLGEHLLKSGDVQLQKFLSALEDFQDNFSA